MILAKEEPALRMHGACWPHNSLQTVKNSMPQHAERRGVSVLCEIPVQTARQEPGMIRRVRHVTSQRYYERR